MASTMRTIFWAVNMLFAVLIMCSFLAVQLLHPIMKGLVHDDDCIRCPRAYISIKASMITFFQTLVMGDGIGDLLIPLLEADFVAAVLILIFVSVVYLGFSNLILSVIVEKANEARNRDTTYKSMVDRKAKAEAKKDITQFWRELEDDNGQNTMSLQELKHLYATSWEFRDYFKRLDIDMPFLEYAFKIMDADGSGDCTLEDFASSVVKLKTTDPGPVVSFIKYQIQQMGHDISELKRYVIQNGCRLDAQCEKDQLACKQDPRISNNALVSTRMPEVDLAFTEWPGEHLETEEAKHSPELSKENGPKPVRPTESVEHVCQTFVQTDPMHDPGNVPSKMTFKAAAMAATAAARETKRSVPENGEKLVIGTAASSSSVRSIPHNALSVEQSPDLVDMLRAAYEHPQRPKDFKASSTCHEQPHTMATQAASVRETEETRPVSDLQSPVRLGAVSSVLFALPSLQGVTLSRHQDL